MKSPVSAAVVSTIVLALLIGAAYPVRAASEVAVVNTPSVVVPSPIPHARLEQFVEIPVSSESATLIPLDLFATGFTSATVSLAVDVQGTAGRSRMVTATLLPDVPLVLKAYQKDGIKLFPIEVGALVEVSDRINVFGSQPMVFPLGFPKYKVIITNHSDRPVKAYLYVYLTN